MEKNAMNINVDTLNKMIIDNDIIITLNLAKLMPKRKQIRLISKLHSNSDGDCGYKNMYLYKKSMKSPDYMLGIDFRNVFFNKAVYFNQNMLTYIRACKSYALNTFNAFIDECFKPIEAEEIKCGIKTAFQSKTNSSDSDALQVHLVKNTDYPIAHYAIGFELLVFNKRAYTDMLDRSIMELNEKTNIRLESAKTGHFSYTDLYASDGGLIGGHIFFNNEVTSITDFFFTPFLQNTKIAQILEKFCSSRNYDFEAVINMNNKEADKWMNKYLTRILSDICNAIKLPDLNTDLYKYFTRNMQGTPMIHHKYYTMR